MVNEIEYLFSFERILKGEIWEEPKKTQPRLVDPIVLIDEIASLVQNAGFRIFDAFRYAEAGVELENIRPSVQKALDALSQIQDELLNLENLVV